MQSQLRNTFWSQKTNAAFYIALEEEPTCRLHNTPDSFAYGSIGTASGPKPRRLRGRLLGSVTSVHFSFEVHVNMARRKARGKSRKRRTVSRRKRRRTIPRALPEWKHFTFDILDFPVVAAGVVIPAIAGAGGSGIGISTGSSSSQRIGRFINVRSASVQITAYMPARSISTIPFVFEDDVVTFRLVEDKYCNNTQAIYSAVYQGTSFTSLRNLNNSQRLKVVFSTSIRLRQRGLMSKVTVGYTVPAGDATYGVPTDLPTFDYALVDKRVTKKVMINSRMKYQLDQPTGEVTRLERGNFFWCINSKRGLAHAVIHTRWNFSG